MGCLGACAMCTRPHSRRVMEGAGFLPFRELRWDRYAEEGGEGGTITFPDIEFETCSFMYKCLSV